VRDWHAVVAVLLALGVATVLVLVGIAVVREPGHVTPEENSLLSTLGGACVGALATYLGQQAIRRRDPPHDDQEQPPRPAPPSPPQ